MKIKWRNVLGLHTCLKLFPSRCRQNSQRAPKTGTLCNAFPLSGGRSWGYDGRSLPWVASLTWQSLRDFADVIEVLINGLWVTQKGHCPGAQLYQVSCSRIQEDVKGDSPAGLQGTSTVISTNSRKRILPTIVWDQKRTPTTIRWDCSAGWYLVRPWSEGQAKSWPRLLAHRNEWMWF